MTDQNCAGCRFWEPSEEEFGDCRRYPRRWVDDICINPQVTNKDWCGEFKPREECNIENNEMVAPPSAREYWEPYDKQNPLEVLAALARAYRRLGGLAVAHDDELRDADRLVAAPPNTGDKG